MCQTCAEDLCEGLKLADSLFSEGKWRVVGGRAGGWALKMTSSWLLSDWIRFVILPPPFPLRI